ncbi:hypothetical protein [Rhizobium leguminosarum]|uniref:hypothetical protein n=1 Tax=Rhizobium leguminosarum TaxID=384 RepID=UPI001FEF016C|nr:hypothetical protein [Rhizobium leguminosarum]
MREADAVIAEAEVIKASERLRAHSRTLGKFASAERKAAGGCRSLAVRVWHKKPLGKHHDRKSFDLATMAAASKALGGHSWYAVAR